MSDRREPADDEALAADPDGTGAVEAWDDDGDDDRDGDAEDEDDDRPDVIANP